MVEDDEKSLFMVVRNHEEQYSLWPAGKTLPQGWVEAGKSGLKSECLEFVDQVWVDMRPLSLRQQMDAS